MISQLTEEPDEDMALGGVLRSDRATTEGYAHVGTVDEGEFETRR